MVIDKKLRSFLEENNAIEAFKAEALIGTDHKSISESINWEYSKKGAKYWADLAFKYRNNETRK